ncbi:MAG: nitrophenyl compound nitroreductase subunit ArsF family protein [Candidatus Gracilibacteria bacterium]|nr:nitrophenyl compound nitroreductase subunit ArsF family protein [Candidatus Gracilibacteria bacterium]
MKKIVLMVMFVSIVLSGCSNNEKVSVNNTNSNTPTKQIDYSKMQSKMKPSKIEIIEFHNTQRCATCLKAEELIKKTLETKFSEETKKGLITFKDIDIDLSENSEITNKFQATGLSVAINTITNGDDNVEFDNGGWRLVSNEEQYIAYFENKINNLLGN